MTTFLKRTRLLLALLFALSLAASACGSGSSSDGETDSSDSSEDESSASDTDADDDADSGSDDGSSSGGGDMPGEGVEVSMARASWDTGYMQAAIYQQLLGELGYTVNDPSEQEMDPATFFPALAEGDIDFWANTWFPTHRTQFIEGTPVEGKVEQVGNEMLAGGLQGILIDKATADEYGITSIDQIGADPELSALFDSTGDGIADVYACDEGWGCRTVIEEWFTQNGWNDTTLDQLSASYTAVFTEAVARVNDGQPTLVYSWTPSAYVTELRPGDNVYWLSTENPLPEQAGAAALGEDTCPGQPCEMGFVAADIMVSANVEFLAANPAAKRLFELVEIPVTDVALQNVEYQNGANTEEDVANQAASWIEQNREKVDAWLEEARNAA